MPQYAFLGPLRVNVTVTLPTHTHSFTWSRICIRLSSAVFKIFDQWSVKVSSKLWSDRGPLYAVCDLYVVCSVQSTVCSLQMSEAAFEACSKWRQNIGHL